MSETGRVFITGGTGFIGSHLAKRLILESGWGVRALVRNPDKARWLGDLGVEILPGDITEPSTLQGVMDDCQIVYHSAASVSESGSKDEVWAVNVTGTRHVVEAALAAGVRRFVHISTCGVYGSLQVLDIDETTPVHYSGDLYKDSKIAAEEIVFQAHQEHGLPVVVARPSQVYGPARHSSQYGR